METYGEDPYLTGVLGQAVVRGLQGDHNADDKELMWGNYNPVPKYTITLLEALRTRIPE